MTEGGHLQCAYHGYSFNAQGASVHVPQLGGAYLPPFPACQLPLQTEGATWGDCSAVSVGCLYLTLY